MPPFTKNRPLGLPSHLLLIALLASFVSACGAIASADGEKSAVPPGEDAASPSATMGARDADGPPPAFAQCAICHKVDEATHMPTGPHLVGIYGAEAGSREGYSYSAALKNSGIVWDEQTLDAFIKSPRKTVAGTKMGFGGVADEAKRDELVEFLTTLE